MASTERVTEIHHAQGSYHMAHWGPCPDGTTSEAPHVMPVMPVGVDGKCDWCRRFTVMEIRGGR